MASEPQISSVATLPAGTSVSRGEPKLKEGELLDNRLAKALAHPMRVSILAAASVQPKISPAEFAREQGVPVQKVSYHFKALAKYGALELVDVRPVRGAVEHFYRGTRRAIFGKADWQKVPESIKGGLAGAALRDFVGVTVGAIEAGTFQARDDFVFSWEPITLDERGWRAMVKKLKATWTWISSLEEESAARLEESGEEGMRAIFAIAGFEAPKPD